MKQIDIKRIKTIVVIQTAFIGDTAISLLFCNSLKSEFPDAKLIFVCTPQSKDLIENCKIIDMCIQFDKRGEGSSLDKIKKTAYEINGLNPDIVFSLHRSLRTSLLVNKINCDVKIGFSNAACPLVYDLRAKYYFNLHESDRNHELLKLLDIKKSAAPIDFNSDFDFEKFIHLAGNPLVYIAPGSVWLTKQWLPEYYGILISELEKAGCRVIIGGSEKEKNLCQKISAGSNAMNVAGVMKLNDTVNLLKKCKLAVCNDSATTHLAGLAGIKCLTIYGATSELFGFYPLTEGSAIIKQEVECSPCAIHGGMECPLGHFKCMKELKPQTVSDKIKGML